MRRTRLPRCGLAVLGVISAVLVSPSTARVFQTNACVKPAPTLATLRRSDNTASNAEVVYSNCSVVKISSTSSNGTTTIDASNLEIQAIASFPDVTTLVLSGNEVTSIYEDTQATVKTLDLSSNGLSSVDALTFPSSVTKLVLDGNSIVGVDSGEIPDTVSALSLKTNGIIVLTGFTFSDTLVTLDTSGNTIHDLSKWEMPAQLEAYSCQNCGVQKLSGMTLPAAGTLTALDLSGSTIDSYEIANSSEPLIAALGTFKLTVSSSSCSDSSATKEVVQSVSVCVLPDAVYNSKYVIPGTVRDSSGAPPLPNGSQAIETSSSSSSSSSGWMLVAMISGVALLLVIIGGAVAYLVFRHRRTNEKFNDYTADRTSGFRSVDDIVPSNNPTAHTFFDRTLNTGMMEVEMHSELDDTIVGTKRRGMNSTVSSMASTNMTRVISARHLDNDIRTDQEMRHFRLMHEEVTRGKLIAKGGYGAVYKATFRDKQVVTKQLLPERARDPRMLNDFMDEIRTCSTLDHPKIVTFLGFTFSSLMDLSAVFEYMPNGDLASLLQKQLKKETRDPSARSSYGWFRSNKTERGGLKCKSLLALDVAEALVYLHSFESPMIHRDLKPNNVLLSEKWEAKLTDFGVSRELTEDQTMTAEIGTISWIAPEVLRGERYSEKADVYSFGVIMTELDTCRRPYSEGIPNDDNRGGNVKHTNARIAVLVSAGKLRPSLSPDCPNSVRDLVDKCLDSDPANRPSALQLHYELRNLELALDDLAITGRMSNPMPRNNCRPPRRPTTHRSERGRKPPPMVHLVEDDDIALLSAERRDHVNYYV
ncbi:TKL protein kinase [Phytophthora cinnamomi]|uniref:TKL protein kinase n=1 Tax=Phytophthora cinnamomi TaxID=4785 RepID=UPI00355941C5|nr:TKL protein kinase [Phytophthora cinnamomi]